uniref:Uncharacterized protein n=1 Tax=Plectus sambesii TaxID=2011161 RepID=A0A914VP03_9BILA
MGAKAIKEADQNERDSSCGFVEIDEKKVAESKNMNAALLTMAQRNFVKCSLTTASPLSKETLKPNFILEKCMKMDMVSTSQVKKLLGGTVWLLSREKRPPKIVLEKCIMKGKVLTSQVKKLLSGTVWLLNRVKHAHKIVLDGCMNTGTVLINHMKKLQNGSKKQQNKEM